MFGVDFVGFGCWWGWEECGKEHGFSWLGRQAQRSMSEDRKRFLKQFSKGRTSVPRGPSSKEEQPKHGERIIHRQGGERLRYLASLVSKKETEQRTESNAAAVVESHGVATAHIKVDLESLQAFCARASLTGGTSHHAPSRNTGKRLGYDNRLRRMNAKFVLRNM